MSGDSEGRFDAVRVVIDKALHMLDEAEQHWETGGERAEELRAAQDDLRATTNALDREDLMRLRQFMYTLMAVTE